jgi:heme/copper-type cytochrome/quinol oxidase subunit 2
MVFGSLRIFEALMLLGLFAWPANWLNSILSTFSIPGQLPDFHLTSLVLTGSVLFRVILDGLIIYGAVQMLKLRSHAWAVASAILAILCLLSCSVLGLVLGIWAMVVLSRPEVQAAFRSHDPRPPTARGGGAWKWVLIILAILFVLVAGVVIWVGVEWYRQIDQSYHTQAADTGDLHQDLHLTYPLTADGTFSLEDQNGRITITGWDQNEVEVSAVKHGGSPAELEAVKVQVDAGASRVAIHTRHPDGERGFRWSWTRPWIRDQSHEVDYTIKVPQHARLADIDSVNGRIEIAGVGGDIKASTVNGQTRVTDAAGSLKLGTVNGRITAEFVRLAAGQEASFNSVNGAIEVTLPADADASVSASTVNGAITSDFPALEVKKEFPIGNHLNGRLGGGGARVHAEAVNGSIHFKTKSN